MQKSKLTIPKTIELVFDIIYLMTVFSVGAYLLIYSNSSIKLWYALMVLSLGAGDSFHLVPRILSASSRFNKDFKTSLGIGKLLTSITMTIFYVILWNIGRMYFNLSLPISTFFVYFLAIIRIALCFFSQNGWTSKNPSPRWSVIRNIPFILLGVTVMSLYLVAKKPLSSPFAYMWLAIALSFAFYLPVAFCAHKTPKLGMLMLPKSCAYIWIALMGLGL